jgi:hypothetical protein
MLLTIFIALLAAAWLAAFITAFCPLRAWRRRKEQAEADRFENQPLEGEKTDK